MRRIHASALSQVPGQEREVDPGRLPNALPAPHSWVDVEQFEDPVSRVALEFDLDKAGKSHRVEKLLRRKRDVWTIDRLDVCARSAEVRRVLPRASGDD